MSLDELPVVTGQAGPTWTPNVVVTPFAIALTPLAYEIASRIHP